MESTFPGTKPEEGPTLKSQELIIQELTLQLHELKLKHEKNMDISQRAINLARMRKLEADDLRKQNAFLIDRLENCKDNHLQKNHK